MVVTFSKFPVFPTSSLTKHNLQQAYFRSCRKGGHDLVETRESVSLLVALMTNISDQYPLSTASLISGPLASTSAYLTKVSTCPPDGNPPAQHLICLYMPDIYDKQAVTDVRLNAGLYVSL